MDYGKKTVTTSNEDGSTTIREEGYFNGLASIVEHTRVDVAIDPTTTLFKELVKCLDLLKTDSPDIIIRIAKDKYGEPQLLQKTWETRREKIR